MEKNIGVALSGSGFLGILHIGALCALEDMGYEVADLAGTSGGAIIAALYACGHTGKDLKDLFHKTDLRPFLEYHPFSAMWHRRDGLCDGSALLEWLEAQCGKTTFADLSIPLKIMATNLTTGRSFEFSSIKTPEAPVSLAARASSAIPVVYASVTYDACTLQDGGMVCNIPTDKLSSLNRRIGLEVTYLSKYLLPDAGWIQKAEQAISLMLTANEDTRVAWAEEVGVDIIPLSSMGFSPLDRDLSTDQKNALFDNGYSAVMNKLGKKGKTGGR